VEFIKKELLMIITTILLAIPMFYRVDAQIYEFIKAISWVIFWIYLFKSYKINKNWTLLFVLPILLFNPIITPTFSVEMAGVINGLIFVIALSWILKMLRIHLLENKR